MRERLFKISLDPNILESFDDALGEQEHISAQQVFSGKHYKGLNAWDCVCSCVHRIRDTVGYLNDMELGRMAHGNAFDFMEFMNNASVVIDSVNMLASIFAVSLDEENERNQVFGEPGSDGKGTDKDYFEFIRSLCVVHPTDTSRHPRYQGSKLVTCPYITWTDSLTRPAFNDCDLHANAFVNEASSWGDSVNIYINQIFDYVEYRYSLLNKVKYGLVRYQDEALAKFRRKHIEVRAENESVSDYVDRLKQEERKRFGDANDYVFDMAKDLLFFEPTDERNKAAVARYKNAWLYALDLELNSLRNMSRIGPENGGLEGDSSGWTLFENLWHCHSGHPDLKGYGYQLEKLHYLDGMRGPSDARWGRRKLFEMEDVLAQHVCISSDFSDKELYYLALTCLYELALEVPCRINEAIPGDSRYRRAATVSTEVVQDD